MQGLEERKEYITAGLKGSSFHRHEDGSPEGLWNLPEVTQ